MFRAPPSNAATAKQMCEIYRTLSNSEHYATHYSAAERAELLRIPASIGVGRTPDQQLIWRLTTVFVSTLTIQPGYLKKQPCFFRYDSHYVGTPVTQGKQEDISYADHIGDQFEGR